MVASPKMTVKIAVHHLARLDDDRPEVRAAVEDRLRLGRRGAAKNNAAAATTAGQREREARRHERDPRLRYVASSGRMRR